jgi:Kef-type K+ transport system membrane component KefB
VIFYLKRSLSVSIGESTSLNNSELGRLFFAIVLLLLSAHSFGYLFQRLKLPRVIGEIFGGVLLGPTIFGNFSLRLPMGSLMASRQKES